MWLFCSFASVSDSCREKTTAVKKSEAQDIYTDGYIHIYSMCKSVCIHRTHAHALQLYITKISINKNSVLLLLYLCMLIYTVYTPNTHSTSDRRQRKHVQSQTSVDTGVFDTLNTPLRCYRQFRGRGDAAYAAKGCRHRCWADKTVCLWNFVFEMPAPPSCCVNASLKSENRSILQWSLLIRNRGTKFSNSTDRNRTIRRNACFVAVTVPHIEIQSSIVLRGK